MSLFLSIGKNSYFTEDAHLVRSRSQRQASSQVERQRTTQELHWIRGDEIHERLEGEPVKAERSTQSGNILTMLSVGSTWPGHRKGDCSVGKQGRMPSLLTRHCRLIVSKGWCPRTVGSLYTNDLSTPRPAPRITFKKETGLGSNRSSSKAHLGAPGNRSRRDTKVAATPEIEDAAGNSCRAMLQKKRTRFKSISGFKECHKMQFSGIRTG